MARRTIEQRIALSGGREIIRDLRSLGEAGERAFQDIRTAAERAGSPGAELGRAVGNLKTAMRNLRDAAQNTGRALREFGSSTRRLGSALASTAGRVAAVGAGVSAAAVGIAKFAEANTQAVDEAGKTAASLGLAVDEFGRLQFAAEQSGVSANDFERATLNLGQQISELASGGADASNTLSELGISVRDADGNLRSTEAILGDVADVFARLPDGVEQSALAAELFGRRAGPDLIPLLNQGRAGIAALGAEAERLGVVFDDQDIVNATALQDSLNAFRRARQAFQSEIALLLAPSVTEGATSLTDILTENRQAILDLVEGGINRAAPVVSDFFALISGREDEVETEWLITARDRVVAFGRSVQTAITDIVVPAFTAMRDAIQRVLDVVNRIFGTEFTAGQAVVAAAFLKLLGIFKLLGAGIGVLVSGVRLLVASFALIKPIIGVAVASFAVLTKSIAVVAAIFAGLVSAPGLFVAALVAAVAAVVIFWDDIVALFRRGVDAVRGFLSGIFEGFDGTLSGALTVARNFISGLRRVFVAGIGAVVGLLGSIGEGISNALSSAADIASAAWNAAGEAIIGALRSVAQFAQEIPGLVSAGFQRLSELASQTFDALVPIAVDASRRIGTRFVSNITDRLDQLRITGAAIWDFIGDAARVAIDFIQRQIERLGGALERLRGVFDRFRDDDPQETTIDLSVDPQVSASLIEQAWRDIVAASQSAVEEVGRIIGTIGGLIEQAIRDGAQAAPEAFAVLVASASAAWQAVASSAGDAARQIDEALGGIGEAVGVSLAALVASAQAAFAAILAAAVAAWAAVREELSSGVEFDALRAAGEDVWRSFEQAAQSAIASVRSQVTALERQIRRLLASLASAQASASSTSAEAPAFARGGRVRGPGTGTSDSIPAWLSDGEFVVRAAAVRKYGAGFLQALNSMRLPKVPGFASGGLVEGVGDVFRGMNRALAFDMPRFADGGAVAVPAGGRPVTINFGGEQFAMSADDDVIERLGRAAARKNVASLGRRPGWYK